MIQIHGPSLNVSGNITPDTSWVRIRDHYCVKDLDSLLQNYGCVNTKVFQDFFWLPVNSAYTTIFAPIWLSEFCKFNFGLPDISGPLVTTNCFNFMVFKLRTLRQQAIQAVIDRGLTTDCYTYPCDDHVNLNIKSKVFNQTRTETYDNVADYNQFLKEHVFDKSAVSLITETIEPNWQNNMTFTEKTLWPMLSLNFPIWLGGYQQAKIWHAAGFDTFDDVIDHGYQWNLEPMERIYQALDENMRVLTDLSFVSDLRHKLKDRLYKNRTLVMNKHIGRYATQLVSESGVDSNMLKTL